MNEPTEARSAALNDALQNAGHALLTDDPVQSLVRVLTQFRNEYRAEVLAECAAAPAGPAPATDRDTLRQRIAAELARADGHERVLDSVIERYHRRADAVLAVLPAPDQQTAVRAAALHEGADALLALDPAEAALAGQHAWADAAALLRRLAGEAQQDPHSCRNCDGIDPSSCLMNPAREAQQDPTRDGRATLPCNWARTQYLHAPHDWEPQPGMEPVHCPGHPAKLPPMDPVHILGIGADDAPARSGQPETDEETR